MGGGRTEIGGSPVRVWGKRGAERPQTRLRGELGVAGEGGGESAVVSTLGEDTPGVDLLEVGMVR